jgi:futalosine hydrolase
MSFKILYVTATEPEAETMIRIKGMTSVSGKYYFDDLNIDVLVTGIGSAATSWSMQKWFSSNEKPDLVINGGIAGSFDDAILKGDVVMPITDCFADLGIEDGERNLTIFEAGLMNADTFPFFSGLLKADMEYVEKFKSEFRSVNAITVNTATGSEITKNRLVKTFNPDIETMEGATFFYICTREKIPFLALRSISNKVETRNKNNWDINGALDSLSEKLNKVLLRLK